MTDRLTPGQRAEVLREVRQFFKFRDPSDHHALVAHLAELDREEAARREAEAKPRGLDGTHPLSAAEASDRLMAAISVPLGEREGPGSAAAPTEPAICTVCLMRAKWGDECRSFPCPYPKRPIEDKPAPAADDLLKLLRGYEACGAMLHPAHVKAAAERIEAEKARADRLAAALVAAKSRIGNLLGALSSAQLNAEVQAAYNGITSALASEGGDRAKA